MKKKLPLCILLITTNNIIAGAMYVNLYEGNHNCTTNTANIVAVPNGGIPPYSFLWSTGATIDSIVNVPIGVYTVTVYDNAGDSVSGSAQVSTLYNLTGSDFWAMPCVGQCNGKYTLNTNVINGTPPFTVTCNFGTVVPDWDALFCDCANLNSISVINLCDSDFVIVTITDATGCIGTSTFTMYPLVVPAPSLSVNGACNSNANGSVTITNLNPDAYQISIRAATDTISACDGMYWQYVSPLTINNLAAGNYFLQICKATWQNSVGYSADSCPQFFPFTIPNLGPSCSTVEGNVFVDLNANCVNDGGDVNLPGTIIEFTPGPFYAYTNGTGHYTSNMQWGNYNMVQYPTVAVNQLCPALNPYPVSLSSSNLTDTVNFADTSTIAFDVAPYLSHGAAHPGFNFNYGVSVHNNSYIASGMLTVTLNYDPLLTFISANPAPFSTSAGQVVWHLSSIMNFQATSASATFSVPPNPALIGDTLFANVNVLATTAETYLANNTSSTWHIITGSFDPNMKSVEQPAANFIPAVDGWFNYTIQFQNTGNDTAFNVELTDSLDSDLNVRTFVPGASSHPFTIDISGQGVLHFYFNNIYLPDSATDEPNSHGFVSFRIRSKQNLPHGTVIRNRSNIYFDFNPPVNTNTTQNTVDLTLAIQATATTVCTGQPVTLTMIPQLQNTPWRWYAGTCNGMYVGSGNSITVSAIGTTTYFVRDSAGTIPIGSCYRKTITGLPPPSANITVGGPTTFCQGSLVTLTATSSANYLWSTGATTQSINVTTSGNYFVTVSSAPGCSNTSTAVSVTVNPLPSASITPSGPTTFCQGGNVLLTAGGANNYLWSNSSTSQNITVSSSGNYFVTVTDANNCSASTSLSVTVNSLPVASITPGGPATFCQGGNVLLTAGGGNNYLWSTGATTQSINVTTSGNYFVTVTDGNNCSASTSVGVTVNPLPTASITPNGPTTFCAGNSVMLTAGGANNYLWSNSSISQSITVSSSGNYFVTVTDANNCSASTSLSVTVNPLPVASITPGGPTTFCAGNSVMLTAGGANNYLWSNSSISQSITVSSSGNYFVTVTDANNCSASTSLSVTVNPLPVASITPGGPTTFCAGNSVMLTAGGANNYLWSNSSTSQSISVSASGNYFVTVTDGNNCSASTSVSVIVNSNPSPPSITQVIDSLFSTAANGYQWYFSSVLISGATSQSYHPIQSGNYSVVITDANGCTASSTDYPFYMTGTKNLEEDDILIYPNPVTDELTVQSSKFKVQGVEVFDVVGKKCFAFSLNLLKGTSALVDVSILAPGIYFVMVRGEKGIAVRRFVKQKE